MERYIKVGKEFRTYVNQPLIASDVRAYKIVWDTKSDMTNMTLLITAKRADGVMVTDTGTFKNGVGEYILADNMYSVPGNVEIRVSILENTSVLTEKILVFEVLEGNNTDLAVGAETNTPVLNTLTVRITELYNLISNIPKKTSQLANDSGFVTEESLPTKTSELTNDSGFITMKDVPENLSEFNDDIGVSENKRKISNLFENFIWEYSHTGTETQANFVLEDTTDNLITQFEFNGFSVGSIRFEIEGETSGYNSFVIPEYTEKLVLRNNKKVFIKLQGQAELTEVTDNPEYLVLVSRLQGMKTFRGNSIITITGDASIDNCSFSFAYDKTIVPTKTSDLTNDNNFISQQEAEEEFVKKEEGKGLSTADYHPIETIVNIKTEDGISNFNISKDTNNNAFKLDEIYIYISRPSELDANYTWSIYANNSQESSYAMVYGSPSKTLNALSFHSQRLCEGFWQTEELQKNTSSGLTIGYAMKAVNYIKSLQLNLPGLPTGSTIIVCGRRVE